MSSPVVELAKGVQARLQEVTGKTFVRLYNVKPDPKDLVDGRWFIMPSGEEFSKKKFVDDTKFSVDLGYFRALPDATEEHPIPDQNLDWLDAEMSEVESVKALFREGGTLDKLVVNDCAFMGMTNNPIYHPDAIEESQVFISILRLDFLVDN